MSASDNPNAQPLILQRNARAEADALEHDDPIYRFAVEAGRIGVWQRNLANDVVTISPVLAQLLGLSSEQTVLSAEQWQGMVDPRDISLLEQEVRRAFLADEVAQLEFRIRLPNGQIAWFSSRGRIYKDDSGNPERAIGVMFDITDKKLAQNALRASEERYRLLTDASPDGILVTIDNRIVYANQSAAQIFKATTASEVIGRSLFELIHQKHHNRILARHAFAPHIKTATALAELCWRRLDGTLAEMQTNAGEITWEGQRAVQYLLRDVSELNQTRDKLRIQNERLKLAVEGRGEGIWDWDLVENSYSISPGLKRIFGWDDAIDLSATINWREWVHREDLPRIQAELQKCIDGETPIYQCEFRARTKDGQWKWVLSRGVVVARDVHQRPVVLTGTMTDITSQKESDELIWRHANLDALTGLPNRRHFRERLEQEVRIARRAEQQLALLFIDLDGFKQVNDVFGHDSGDVLLSEAARRIRQCVRETDVVARLGGDEFTVVLSGLDDLNHIEIVCQHILNALAEPFYIGTAVAYVSGSIGVALYPMDAGTADDLVRLADQAMYAAKKSGKKQFSYFASSMDVIAHTRLRITNELRHALETAQLSIYFQPVINLTDGRIDKAEALLRWTHPQLGSVEPSVFIPLAEESGLMASIGNWLFKEAAMCAKCWSERLGRPFQVSINKSPVQFLSRELEADWLGYLRHIDLAGSAVVVEITESLLLHAASPVMDKLLAFRDAGVQVAIDDFGTGYSSLAYLQKFDIDYLKIDQSFVHNIHSNEGNRAIAESIIVMAHRLGLKVIAEGIETEAQRACLAQAGCDYGQGFLFSHPLPARQFEQALLGLV